MSDYPQLSEKEFKIRKLWLVCSLVFIFGISLLSATYAIFLFTQGLMIKREMAMAWLTTVANLISFFVIYYCAYKKHGTRLLLFCFLCAPLKILGVALFFKQADLRAASLLGLGLDSSLYILWYFLSIKLWKINKKVRFQKASLNTLPT